MQERGINPKKWLLRCSWRGFGQGWASLPSSGACCGPRLLAEEQVWDPQAHPIPSVMAWGAWGEAHEPREVPSSVVSSKEAGWGLKQHFPGGPASAGQDAGSRVLENCWRGLEAPQNGEVVGLGGLPGGWHSRSSLPREEEGLSLTACRRIIPLSLLIPPRKPGWAAFFLPPPPISLKCNSFHQNLVSHEAYNEFYIYLKWSDIRHPIIPTPREKHGLDV